MAKILAFAGSNSSTSINHKLVSFTVDTITGHEVQLLNMVRYPFPMFSEDVEREKGYSNSLVELKDDIKNAQGLVLSVNEHNGGPSAYFKNIIDWLSRLDRRFLSGTKVFLMSASPGKGGASNAHATIEKSLGHFGGEVVATFSLPTFHENFKQGNGILDETLRDAHQQALQDFLSNL